MLRTIEASGWSQIPSVVIIAGLKTIEFCIFFFTILGFQYALIFASILPGLLSILVAVDVLTLRSRRLAGPFTIVLTGLLWIFMLALFHKYKFKWNQLVSGRAEFEGSTALIILLCFYAYVAIYWIRLTLVLPVAYSAFGSFVLCPILGVGLSFLLEVLYWSDLLPRQHERQQRPLPLTLVVSGFSLLVSVFLTFGALLLGHILVPAAWVPQTGQALTANLLADVLTILGTAWIVAKTIPGVREARTDDRRDSSTAPVKGGAVIWPASFIGLLNLAWSARLFRFRAARKPVWLPAAVALDVLLALVCAYSSLCFAVAFTNHSLNPREISRVFIARAIDGSHWEAGPLFWMMHTTFIPVAVYATVVLLAWWAKATLRPITYFLKRANHPEINSVGLTARVVALMAAIAGMISFASDTTNRLLK